MSTSRTRIIINRLPLPLDVLEFVKEYVFHKIKKIDCFDDRYQMVATIPQKIHCFELDGQRSAYVCLFVHIRAELIVAFKNNRYYVQSVDLDDEQFHWFTTGNNVHEVVLR